MIERRNVNFTDMVAKRLQNFTPSTYDESDRTVDAVLSRGSPVTRFYGREQLEISRKAIDLSRMESSGVAVLDSHQQIGIANALGRLTRVWIENDSVGAALMGTVRFNATSEGKKAEAMVARGEITGVSIGYSIQDWKITDDDGDEVDPASRRWDEDGLTFTAIKWQLAELSLVATPADAAAGFRAAAIMQSDRAFYTASAETRNCLARIRARQAMAMRGSGVLYLEPSSDNLPRSSIFDEHRHVVYATGINQARYANGLNR